MINEPSRPRSLLAFTNQWSLIKSESAVKEEM